MKWPTENYCAFAGSQAITNESTPPSAAAKSDTKIVIISADAELSSNLLIKTAEESVGEAFVESIGSSTADDTETPITSANDEDNEGSSDETEPDADLSIKLMRQSVTYGSAVNGDDNIIALEKDAMRYKRFTKYLWTNRNIIKDLVRHHIGVADDVPCRVFPIETWYTGNFNTCIPVMLSVSETEPLCFMMRCAVPFKLCEKQHPGTMDEKVRGEVGTYVWMQTNCTDIRIPFLHGFGFSDHTTFTHYKYRPWYNRVWHWARKQLYRLFHSETCLSSYVSHPTRLQLATAYILLEHVAFHGTGMLSNTLPQFRDDEKKRVNLFKGLSKIMLSLARIPQTRIGSFGFHNNGTVTLTNRPLDANTMILENEGTPRAVPPNTTYTCIEAYTSDLFHLQDPRLISYRNAIWNKNNCEAEMAARAVLRSVAHRYMIPRFRNGPFYLQLTDLHGSNIFVDEDWNITCLIDLEWACTLPIERLDPPYWLSGHNLAHVWKHADEHKRLFHEFMDIFEQQELKYNGSPNAVQLSAVMRDALQSGRQWFWIGITSVNAAITMFNRFIRPQYFSKTLTEEQKEKQDEIISHFMVPDGPQFVQTKLGEYREYIKDLNSLYREKGEKPDPDPTEMDTEPENNKEQK